MLTVIVLSAALTSFAHPQATPAPGLPPISVDARLIEQALISLLANATLHGASDRPIEASVARDDSSIVFSVADHGPGPSRPRVAPTESKS